MSKESTLEEKYAFVNKVAINSLKALTDAAFSLYSYSLNHNTKLFHELHDIKVGDLVFETTSYVMSKGNARYNSIGHIKEMNEDKSKIVIMDLSGELISWTNCKFIKILASNK